MAIIKRMLFLSLLISCVLGLAGCPAEPTLDSLRDALPLL